MIRQRVEPNRLCRKRSRIRRCSLGAESGQVFALMAVGLVALVAMGGFAVDVGKAYQSHRRAQQAADASALGAAQLLPGEHIGGDRRSADAPGNEPVRGVDQRARLQLDVRCGERHGVGDGQHAPVGRVLEAVQRQVRARDGEGRGRQLPGLVDEHRAVGDPATDARLGATGAVQDRQGGPGKLRRRAAAHHPVQLQPGIGRQRLPRPDRQRGPVLPRAGRRPAEVQDGKPGGADVAGARQSGRERAARHHAVLSDGQQLSHSRQADRRRRTC